MIWRSSDTVYL